MEVVVLAENWFGSMKAQGTKFSLGMVNSVILKLKPLITQDEILQLAGLVRQVVVAVRNLRRQSSLPCSERRMASLHHISHVVYDKLHNRYGHVCPLA